jgi:hypothetical protein
MQAIAQVTGVRRKTRQSRGHPDHVLVRICDAVLDGMHRLVGAGDRQAISSFCLTVGIWAGLILFATVIVLSLYAATKSDSFAVFGRGVGVGVVLLVLLYSAGKCGHAIAKGALQLNTPVLHSGVLRGIGLLLIGIGLVTLGVGVCKAVILEESDFLLWNIPFGVVMCYCAIVLMPDVVPADDEPQEVSLANDAISVVKHCLKAMLWTVPMLFFIGLALSTAFLSYHLVGYASTDGFDRMRYFASAAADVVVGIVAAGAPLLVYILVLFGSIIIEAVDSIITPTCATPTQDK